MPEAVRQRPPDRIAAYLCPRPGCAHTDAVVHASPYDAATRWCPLHGERMQRHLYGRVREDGSPAR